MKMTRIHLITFITITIWLKNIQTTEINPSNQTYSQEIKVGDSRKSSDLNGDHVLTQACCGGLERFGLWTRTSLGRDRTQSSTVERPWGIVALCAQRPHLSRTSVPPARHIEYVLRAGGQARVRTARDRGPSGGAMCRASGEWRLLRRIPLWQQCQQ